MVVVIGIGCTFVEDSIRTFGAELGGGNKLPNALHHHNGVLQMQRPRVLRDYKRAIDLYVEKDSRSFVSSDVFSYSIFLGDTLPEMNHRVHSSSLRYNAGQRHLKFDNQSHLPTTTTR